MYILAVLCVRQESERCKAFHESVQCKVRRSLVRSTLSAFNCTNMLLHVSKCMVSIPNHQFSNSYNQTDHSRCGCIFFLPCIESGQLCQNNDWMLRRICFYKNNFGSTEKKKKRYFLAFINESSYPARPSETC